MELNMHIFWILTPIAVVIYYFGVGAGIVSARIKGDQDPNGGKFWWDCHDCVPGVSYRISADTKDHLDQVIQWHVDDHHNEHEEEKEEWIPETSSLWSWLEPLQSGLHSTWEGFKVTKKRWKKKLTLPAYRSVGHQAELDLRKSTPGRVSTALRSVRSWSSEPIKKMYWTFSDGITSTIDILRKR